MDSTINHPQFGSFKYDQRMEWYVGSINFNDETVDVCLPAEDEISLQRSLDQLTGIYANLAAIDSSAREFATEELLEEKNSDWLADGETEISTEEFQSRLALESIIIGAGSSTEFFYDDDGMFFDHAVLLTRHNDGLWVSAEIAD